MRSSTDARTGTPAPNGATTLVDGVPGHEQVIGTAGTGLAVSDMPSRSRRQAHLEAVVTLVDEPPPVDWDTDEGPVACGL
jgi:hypothetical protein